MVTLRDATLSASKTVLCQYMSGTIPSQSTSGLRQHGYFAAGPSVTYVTPTSEYSRTGR